MLGVRDRLAYVESKQPLVFDEIDFTVRNPERVASELAAPLEYAQRVEHLVGVTHMERLMPRRSPEVERFLAVWTDDELGHARALGHLMEMLGLRPVPIDGAAPPSHNAKIGAVARLSPSLHEVV